MEWKEVRLGDVCSVITKGTTPSSVGGSFVDSGIKYIRSEMIGFSKHINSDGFLFITDEIHNKLKRSQLAENDILFSMAGAYLGKTAILRKEDVPANTNQAVALIRVNEDFCNEDFIYYCLNIPSLVKYVNSSSAQSAQPNINLKQIGDLLVPYPPIATQRRIVNILSSLDRKIELNNKINAQLEEMAQTLFKHWFVDFGPFKDGKFVESELGMIPEGWRVGTLNDICEYSKERIPIESLDNSTYYSTENMLPNKQGATTAASLPSIEATTRCMINDVLVSNIRPYFKKIIRVDKTCGCSTDVLCFHSKRSIYDTFMYLSIFDDKFFDYVMAGSKGTKMPRGDKKQIMQYPIVLPVENNLEQFSLLLEPILSHLSLIKVENRKLAALRDTLLPKLMSGEINLEDYGGE